VTLDCGKRWLAERRKASVLSIVTTWVWNGSPFTVPSAMAKSGINAMTQSLAVEWGGRGIRFNAIAPGLFPTEGMSARLNPQGGEHKPEGNPMDRAGRMPELANLAVFLMSRQAEYLTGQTIAIDGAQYQATGGNFASLGAWDDAQWQAARDAIADRNRADRAQRTV
jgi:NAD(P)-dependent dehydrogenase (short-subunit alcohol dehydrogenase family)